MSPAGFEPIIPASERLQNYALGVAATWIGGWRYINPTNYLSAPNYVFINVFLCLMFRLGSAHQNVNGTLNFVKITN